jgi:hypothetical protein
MDNKYRVNPEVRDSLFTGNDQTLFVVIKNLIFEKKSQKSVVPFSSV